ncbi:MAG: phenylacetate--CoA ligase family protein [Marinilabiliaceae bacterium]|nr:phenylacetate--CoA ligase family protein [Marinilabiliaceae bacterium]
MIDFFTLLRFQGYPVKRAFDVWEEISAVDDLFEWQLMRRDELVMHLFEQNASYRNLAQGYNGQWDKLPVLTKEIIKQSQLTEAMSHGKRHKIFYGSTSGSSGRPFVFEKDGLTHCLTWLLVKDRYARMGVGLNDCQARFYGAPLSLMGRWYERTKDYVGHRFRFPVLDLSDAALRKWLDIFKGHQFKYIYGYSYPLIVFARFLHQQGIVLADISPSLNACILTAEMCSPDERVLIERALGVSVANEYGTSELGIVGFSSDYEWMLSDELLYTEVVDDDGVVLQNGELGNIVCTSLFNRGTPFIRYQTGDLGAIVQKNGRRYLTGLMGRREDLAVLPSGRLAPGDTVFYYVFKDFATRFDVIQEYKVIQKRKDLFEIQYVGGRDLNGRELRALEQFCSVSLERGLTLVPVRMQVLDRTRMGKFRRFISEVKFV